MKRIYWAGDSTVQFNDITTFPQTGIGQVISLYLKKTVIVKNYAKNGRSTKSFLEQGRLDEINELLKKDDFLFIQFGHNDEKTTDPERYTKPKEDYIDNLKKFISAARKVGAYPVLITPLERRCYISEHELGQGEHSEYVKAMKSVALEENVPLIDLYEMSREALIRAGATETLNWYMHIPARKYPYKWDGLDTDNTHLQYIGAVIFAGMIAKGLNELGGKYDELLIDNWDRKVCIFKQMDS